MSAGIIDHETGTRDMRRMGGLFKTMPRTSVLGILAAGSMAGVVVVFSIVYAAMCPLAGRRAKPTTAAGLSGAAFLLYACERRLRCPLEEKPACKHCPVHCYRPGHREKVREIMRFSGRHLIRRGRLDLLWRYLF